jgi:hypothetical protein
MVAGVASYDRSSMRVSATREPRSSLRYEGTMAEGKLTFEGPARFQYRLGDDGRIAVNPDGTISVAWWLWGWRPACAGCSGERDMKRLRDLPGRLSHALTS